MGRLFVGWGATAPPASFYSEWKCEARIAEAGSSADWDELSRPSLDDYAVEGGAPHSEGAARVQRGCMKTGSKIVRGARGGHPEVGALRIIMFFLSERTKLSHFLEFLKKSHVSDFEAEIACMARLAPPRGSSPPVWP